MNDPCSADSAAPGPLGPTDRAKAPYSPPTLVFYGKVAALTQSASGCDNNDNSSCAGVGGRSSPKTAPSDPRVKERICRIGTHPKNIGVYLFNYKPEYCSQWGHGRQFGVMADEVERVMPEAVVVHPDGYKMVDYALLGITQNLH